MHRAPEPSLYQRLGVPPEADRAVLRAAYRRLALELHPDVAAPADADGANRAMAELNLAWAVLSDPERRRRYDAELSAAAPAAGPATGAAAQPGRRPAAARRSAPPRPAAPRPAPPTPAPGWRRDAWFAGVRLQIRRLGALAGRSAAQTVLVRRRGQAREACEAAVEPIVEHLLADTEERVRAARAAGAAPLDLGIVATLIGLRSAADRLLAELRAAPERAAELTLRAELVDRMFDTLAHELPHDIVVAVGGGPKAVRRLTARR